jgi:CheY-like chemotaxis protein
VLVVEDEADLREVMGLVLSGGGYSVQLAADAGEAIALLHSDHFDVVVTDLLMPGGGGRRVLDHTRQLPTPPPVIVLTGKVEPGAGESADDLGATACLHKPLGGREVLEAVKRVLG